MNFQSAFSTDAYIYIYMKQCKETKMMIWTHCFKHFNPWSLSRLFIGHGEAYSGTYMIQECCLFLDSRKL